MKPENMIGGNRYKKRKVLVTGASGYIGSHLCKLLQYAGAETHGVSRKAPAGERSGIFWWKGDLSNKEFTGDLVKNIEPEYIFHLAGYVKGSRALENVDPAFTGILSSTVNILTAATDVGCKRIILSGSLEEPGGENPNEIPSSPYAIARWSASAYARMFHALYGTPVTIARIFMVYGPGHQDLQKLIPYVTLSLLQGKPPTLSSGKRQIDWIYVEDVARGLLALASSDHLDGQTMDIGSGSLISVEDMANKLAEFVGGNIQPKFGSLPEREMEQVRMADMQKTLETIGWKPDICLEEGLKITVDWYRERWKKDLIGSA